MIQNTLLNQWKIISNDLNTKYFKISLQNRLISIPTCTNSTKNTQSLIIRLNNSIHVDCHCTVLLPNFKIFPSYFLIKISHNICRRLMHLLSIRWHVHFFVTLRVKAGFYFILLYNLRQSQQPSI